MGTKMRMPPDGKIFEVGNPEAVEAALTVGYAVVNERAAPSPVKVAPPLPPEPVHDPNATDNRPPGKHGK